MKKLLLLGIFLGSFSCKSTRRSLLESEQSESPKGPKIVFGNNYLPEAIRVFRPAVAIRPFSIATPKSVPNHDDRDKQNGETYAEIINVVRANSDQLVFDFRSESRKDHSKTADTGGQLEFYPLISDEGPSPAGKLIFGTVQNTVRLVQAYHFIGDDNKRTYVPIEGGGIFVHLAADGTIAGFNSYLVPPPVDISSKNSTDDQKSISRYKKYQEMQQLNLSSQSLGPSIDQIELLKSRILLGIPGTAKTGNPEDILPATVKEIFRKLAFRSREDFSANPVQGAATYEDSEGQKAAHFFDEFSKAKHRLVFAASNAESDNFELVWKVEAPFGLPIFVYIRSLNPGSKDLVLKVVPMNQNLSATGIVNIYNGTEAVPKGNNIPKISNATRPIPDAELADMKNVFSSLYSDWIANPTLFKDPHDIKVANKIGWLAVSKASDFYWNNFGWDSFDGRGIPMDVSVSPRDYFENAHYSPEDKMLVFGNYSVQAGENSFVYDLTIVGHEYGHGIVGHTAKLLYEGQAGALDEHIADVFGDGFISTELGKPNNFRIGEILVATDLGTVHQSLRNMLDKNQNPSPRYYPERMDSPEARIFLGNCVPTARNDGCGVHYLSALPNKVVALTVNMFQKEHAEQNPQADMKTPEHMHAGWKKFSQVFWRTITTRLDPRSSFREYRNGMLNVCKEMVTERVPADLTPVNCDMIAANFDSVAITEANTPTIVGTGDVPCTISTAARGGTNIRDMPSPSGLLFTQLAGGFPVIRTGISGAWVKIKFVKDGLNYGDDGRDAFVAARDADCQDAGGGSSLIDPYKVIRTSGIYQPGEEKCEVTASTLNARNLPATTGATVLNILPRGHKFIATATQSPWKRAEYILDGILYGADMPAHPHWLHGNFVTCRPAN